MTPEVAERFREFEDKLVEMERHVRRILDGRPLQEPPPVASGGSSPKRGLLRRLFNRLGDIFR